MATDRELSDALTELDALREREAAARRETDALLAGLEAMTGVPSPQAALDALLSCVKTTLGCQVVALVRGGPDGTRVAHATDEALADLRLPIVAANLVSSGQALDPLADQSIARAFREQRLHHGSMMIAPVAEDEAANVHLIALDKRRDRFCEADRRLLFRLARLAAQAVAAETLSDRHALLAAVIEGSATSVAIADAMDPTLPLIFINEAFERLTGYTREQVIGQNCRFLSAEEPDCPVRMRLRDTVDRRAAGEFELRNRRRDGDVFWNQLTLFPVFGSNGEATHMVATQVDISERREVERERDQARQRMISALSSTSEGFLLLDQDGHVVFANERFREFFGHGKGSWAVGADFVEIWEGRLRFQGMSQRRAHLEAIRRKKALFRGARDREEKLPDGRVLLINDRPTPDGGAVSIATDVTSLKATEQLLEERAIAIDAAQDGIAITDQRGRFVYMNPSHLRLFGYESEVDVLGRHWTVLYGDQEAEEIQSVAMPELEKTGTWRGEVPGRSCSGDVVHQEISLTLVGGGGLISVTRDASERLRNERERTRLSSQLVVAQRQEAVGQLAAGVAHDFNNVLAAITGSAQLLLQDLGNDSPATAHAERIIAASQRTAQLVTRLMSLGSREVERHRVDLCDPFTEAVDLLRAGIPARIELDVQAPDQPIVTETDPTQFVQVALNLGINARDAIETGAGRVQILLRRAGSEDFRGVCRLGAIDPDSPYAVFEVSDTGVGMEGEAADQVFRPYFTTKGDGGTGLGLAVVSSIIQAVDGAIQLETAPGKGTLFRVFWPLETGRAAPAPELHCIDERVRLDGMTVLLVEDSADVANVLTMILEQAGAEVAACVDPRDAREAVSEDPTAWTVMVTDFDMPHLSGAELGRAVRKVAPEMPILLCTALADWHRRTGAETAVFDKVVAKPVEAAELVAAVHSIVNPRRGVAEGQDEDQGEDHDGELVPPA